MNNKKEQSLTDNKFNGKSPKKPFQKTHKQYYNPSKQKKARLRKWTLLLLIIKTHIFYFL